MPKCKYCNFENPADAKRCGKCGAWLNQDQAPAAPTAHSSNPAPSDPPEPIVSDYDSNAAAPILSDLDAQVLELLRAGRKIEAIKLVRERTGVGLKEVKDAVEALGAEHRIQPPAANVTSALLAIGLIAIAVALAVWLKYR